MDGRQSTGGGNGLLAHFGLGAATNAEVIRIEWPSGIVQELSNVSSKQFLTITEQQEGVAQAPSLTGSLSGDSAANKFPQRFYRAVAPRPICLATGDMGMKLVITYYRNP